MKSQVWMGKSPLENPDNCLKRWEYQLDLPKLMGI